VNTNGVVSFLVGVSQYTPDPFPLADGRRLISPFWGDVDTRNGGTVLYRESTDTVLLDRATADVRRGFLAHQKFSGTWIFIVTWDRVAFFGASDSGKSKVRAYKITLRHRLTGVLEIYIVASSEIFLSWNNLIWHNQFLMNSD